MKPFEVVAEGSTRSSSFEDAVVRGVMHYGVLSCEPEASLRDVARIMASYHVHAVVVALGGYLWGMVSARDVLQVAGTERERVTAGQIAATEFVTITPDATLGEAAQLMREHEVDHVVVTDGAKRPVGMLSTLDIASVLARSDA